ncbi:MAG: hypothetical protein IPJ79_10855 [Bacteroidetes bacterium]|nr:hypothetical protein [Bacteroidota bacterium]
MRAIVTICCAALFVGCIRKSKIDTPVIELDLPDTLLTQQPNFDYIMIKKLVSDLNLPKLETGVDSMEIRIFEEYALSTPDRLITIKFENNSWVFVETKFWTSYPELKNTELVSLIDLCEKVSVDSSITYKITPNVLSTELMGVLRKYQFF